MDNQPSNPAVVNGGAPHALPVSADTRRRDPPDSLKASKPVQSATSTARDGPSSDTHGRDPSMSELPPELQHITFTMQPLGKLVARIAQIASNELHEALDKMAELPPVPTSSTTPNGTNGLTNGVSASSHQPENNSPANQQRKEILFEYAERTRNRFIQLLVLSLWSRSSTDVSKVIDVVNFLRTQEAAQEQASFALGQLKLDIHPFKLPAPDIQTALETLTTGTASKVNALEKYYLPPPELTPERLLKTLRDLNVLLHERILVGIGLGNLPSMLRKWRIRNGRVTFIVPGEFELDVGVAEEEPDPVKARWWFVDVRWDFQPSAEIPQAARTAIETKINQELGTAWNALVEHDAKLQDEIPQADETAAPTSLPEVDRSCLKSSYDFLHNFVLTHKISILRKQAFGLVSSSWAGTLRVEMAHRHLILQYWTKVPGPKSWLEIALHSKKTRQKDPKTGAQLLFWDWRGPRPSTIGVRWMRVGKEMDLKALAAQAGWSRKQIEEHNIEAELCGFGDLRTLDIENALNRTVSMHAIWIFESIRDKLLESRDDSRMLSVEMLVEDSSKSGDPLNPSEMPKNPLLRPSLALRLGPSSPMCRLQIDPPSGALLLTPNADTRVPYALSTLHSSQIPIVAHTHLRRHAALVLLSHLDSKSSHAGWVRERLFRLNRETVKNQTNLARRHERQRWERHGIPQGAIWASETQLSQGTAPTHTLKDPDFFYSALIRPPRWGRINWGVLVTITAEEAERFWVVELSRPGVVQDVKYAVPLYPIHASDTERLGNSFWKYLEKVALGAIGGVVLGRQLSEKGVRFNWFPDGIPDQVTTGSQSSKAVPTTATDGLTSLQKMSVPMLFICFQDLLHRKRLPLELQEHTRGPGSAQARKEKKAARRRGAAVTGQDASARRSSHASSSPWAISALRFQFLDLAVSETGQAMPVYSVTGMFSRDNPLKLILSHPKYRESVPDIHTAIEFNGGELPAIHVAPKGAFALYLRTPFGESPFEQLVNYINSLALLRDFVTTLDRKGLGARIQKINLDSISFEYGDLIRRTQNPNRQTADRTNGESISEPHRGQLTPEELANFSVSLRFADPAQPTVVEFEPTNPHRRLRSHLSHLLHNGGPNAFGLFINALERTGPLMAAAIRVERNAFLASAHTPTARTTDAPGASTAIPSVSTLLTIHVRSIDNVRFLYKQPRCLFDARLKIRRGELEWVFEKVRIRVAQPPAAGKPMQPPAPTEEEARLNKYLEAVFTSSGAGWKGMRTAIVAELDGVGDVVERLDECVRNAAKPQQNSAGDGQAGDGQAGDGVAGDATTARKPNPGKQVIELD